MKKLSHISFLNVAILALAVLVFGGVGVKTFAAADYTTYTPAGCNASLMQVIHLNSGQLINGASLSYGAGFSGAIFVIDDTPIEINGNISIGSDCISVVANADAVGNTVLNFTGDHYITSNGRKNMYIGGANSSKRLELNNISNSFGAILLENVSGATVSYTTISGFDIFGGIILSDTRGSIISNNTITNNLDGINVQGSSLNNTISNNTINYNTDNGIRLEPGVIGQTISNNNINYNTNNGIFVNGSSNNVITNNTGINNNQYGIYFYNTVSNTGTSNIISGSVIGMYFALSNNNTISNNLIKNNSMGFVLDNSLSNTFSSNIIFSNDDGLSINTSSGNIFNGGSISGNVYTNMSVLDHSHYNRFTSIEIQSSLVGIKIENSNYNTFSNVNVTNNTNGTTLNASSNNTLNLTNNNNGIGIDNNSNNNTISNTQILNQNNIFIYDGSANNVITGGLFSASSTTSTSVVISLKNNQTSPKNYSITGSGLSGTYSGIMTGSTGNITIQLSAGDGTKNIVVTYNNGNKQYDSIVLNPTSGGGSSGGGGGGGGGGSVTPTCTSANLVCVNGVRTRTGSTTCQGGNLGHACTVTSGTTSAGTSGSIVGSPFSSELNNAYLRAFANGVTTMNTIQKANMTGALIRAHMAKMISNFAITLGGLTPDTSKQCVFTDIASQSAEMKFYIKLSCQLGLMGQGITKFDPTTVVTRAQFGTILSRVLWGDRYEGGVKYYTDHLAALKRANIMTQIENPNMKEIRGYVMIMMKRTQDLGYLND